MAKTFIKNLAEFKNYMASDIQKYCNQYNNIYSKSFNSNHPTINDQTKVVIVGTFTPKNGRDNGYFYSSQRNEMYNILDNFFYQEKNINTNFGKLKEQLILHPKDKKFIEAIKDELTKFNISLLDVVDLAVSPDDSAADDDIEIFNLDYDTFDEFKKTNAVFVCNSRNAEAAFDIIMQKNKAENIKKDYAPQIWRTSRAKKQLRWNQVLKKYL